MATALGERPSTVQSWKDNGRVPSTKQPMVLDKAKELGISVTANDVVYPLGNTHDAAALSSVHGGAVSPGAPIVACDRGAILHPEARRG